MKLLFASLCLFTLACGGKSSPAPTPTPTPTPTEAACVRSGCSNHVCVEEGSGGGITTCEYRDEYACYESATCERQADGACGWTATPDLQACLASPPPPAAQ